MNTNQTGHDDIKVPQYKGILKETGIQLSRRKKTIFKRTMAIIFPIAIVLVGIIISSYYLETSKFGLTGGDILIITAIFGGLIAIPYVSVMRHIFSVEKLIWVDSYFDQKNLTTKESWRIARRLFWPALRFKIYIFFRFYLPSLFLYVILLMTGFITTVLVSEMMLVPAEAALVFFIVVYAGGAILLWLYYRYRIRVRLRYIWYIFLDTYHPETLSYNKIVKEMNDLNNISKSESFKKSLVIAFGTDATREIVFIMLNYLQAGISALGRGATVFGSVLRLGAEETSRQFIDFAEISAFYILYKSARNERDNESQKINEYIYKLAK
tara:strand:+ start:11862 stop:12836 length:975 start_codon:yes stop_codon:yes gene_type:complete